MNVKAVAIAVANDYILDSNIILLGPQIRYMKQKVQDASGSIPVLDIDMQAYGMMDGSKGL